MRALTDEELINSFNEKCDVLRDCARGVGLRYRTGAYICGRPGTSKSWSITDELTQIGLPWHTPKGRVTAPSLFDLLAEAPEHTLVLDDLSNIHGNPLGTQLLMAALDGGPSVPRKVTYRTRGGLEECWFAGGIIMLSNLPLKRDPLADALRSRCQTYEHEPTDEEVAAFMRWLALQGSKGLSPEACLEVAEYLIDASATYELRIDLRFYDLGLGCRLQYEHGNSRTHWKTLIDLDLGNAMKKRPVKTKADQIADDRFKVRRAIEAHAGDWRAQVKASGLSKTVFYVRKRELEAAGLLVPDLQR